MYDKPGQLCWPPRKSRMADCILFAKENVFCTIFMLAIGRSAVQVGIWIAVLKLNIYMCEY